MFTSSQRKLCKTIFFLLHSEWLEKYDQTDHETDDTVTYRLKKTLSFNPEKSQGLTGDEEITMADYLLNGVTVGTYRYVPSLMPFLCNISLNT